MQTAAAEDKKNPKHKNEDGPHVAHDFILVTFHELGHEHFQVMMQNIARILASRAYEHHVEIGRIDVSNKKL